MSDSKTMRVIKNNLIEHVNALRLKTSAQNVDTTVFLKIVKMMQDHQKRQFAIILKNAT